MMHCGFVPVRVSRAPPACPCPRGQCSRRNLRNWPTLVDQRPMDNFFEELIAPISVILAAALDPEQNLTQKSNLTSKVAKKEQVSLTSDKFLINLNIDGFSPEELSVKTVDNFITIEGKHEEKTENSTVSRSFSRKWAIPEGVKVDEISCNFNLKEGLLQLEAPRLAVEDKSGEKVIPIQLNNQEKKESTSGPEHNVGENEKSAEIEKMAE